MRAVFSPSDLAWEESDALLTQVTQYREGVDLSPVCSTLSAQLDGFTQNLKPLENLPASDEEGQLKRALLQYAQRGWQSAMATGSVTYRAGADETRVEACSARALASSSSTWRPDRVAIVVVAAQLVLLTMLAAAWWIRKARRG